MKLKIRLLLTALAICLLISGCKNTDDKVNDFVAAYNNAAANMSNNIVTHTSAKAVSAREIRIIFKTSLDYDQGNKTVYSQMLPSMVSEITGSDKRFSELIDEGVKIDFVLMAGDDSEISRLDVDKKKYAELKQMKDKPVATGQSHLSPQLQEVLKMLNNSLPIVDKEAGTTITEITIDEKMALVYNIKVENELAESLKNPGTGALMKDELLRDPNVRRMLPGLRTYGISTITYKYVDAKGKILSETSINNNELR